MKTDSSREVGPKQVIAIGYVRASTTEQAESGLGLAAQRITIEGECSRRGWQLDRIEEDAGVSGKSLRGRHGLQAALADLRSGVASALVVSKLDRLSRSLQDFAGVMERARREGWNLVALDLGIDLSTPSGEFMAGVMASAAQWERRIIGQRTRDALQAKKASGARLGRPVTLPDPVRSRIGRERNEGKTLAAIADALNEEGIPTARGGKQWHPETVRAVLRSLELDLVA